MDKRQHFSPERRVSLRFAWRMAKAFLFAFLSAGNAFCLYRMARAITLGHMADTTAIQALFWLGLVAVAILFMCSLHEFVEGICESEKKEDGSCA